MIRNSTIGSNCAVMASTVLDGAVIPDNTSVYLLDGAWRTKPVNTALTVRQPWKTSFVIMELCCSQAAVVDAYRARLSSPDSAQCLAKNFQATSSTI